MKSFKEIIEKRWINYQDKISDWNADMPTGKSGNCDLCPNTDMLTEHHLIPKRVFRGIEPKLMRFIDKLKIEICSKCHGKMHPENVWKQDLLAFENFMDKEIKRWEKKIEGQLLNKDKAVSKARQEVNSLKTKLNNKDNLLKVKEDKIKREKQKINELKKRMIEQKTQVTNLEKDRKLKSIEADDKNILYTFIRMLHTEKEWTKTFTKHVENKVQNLMSEMDRKETVSKRDVMVFAKKVQHALGTGLFLLTYDKDEKDEIIDEINKRQTQIIEKVLEKELNK